LRKNEHVSSKTSHGRYPVNLSPESRPVLWDRLTSEELASLAVGGCGLVILPVGATEQHGPHLVTGADSIEAEALAHAVSARTGVPVLPVLPYGCSLGHSKKWAGTLSLTPQLLSDTIVSLYEWLHAAGFKRLLLLSGHATNHAPLRCAVETIRSQWSDAMVGIHFIGDLSSRVRDCFEQDARDWHANRAESSLMMEICPSGVRMEKVSSADDPDRTSGIPFALPVDQTSRNGVTGFPSQATGEEGKHLFGWMSDDYEELVRAAMKVRSPLEQNVEA
jgi:creatinine amidohydrolase